ncbi:response regulator [Thalassospira mesophila]|uniref:response regulator n=1 Tax=Thalassospira mesophila TaxID=1293891 RepID=UPI000A1F22CB|nr:response regulator [Thalassospira mesophila]
MEISGNQDSGVEPVKVLICDDSVFMRMAIKTVCEDHPEIQVIGEAEDGEEAIAAVRDLKPDIVTMDISMPGLDGVSATTEITQIDDVPVIILSSLTERRSALALRLLEIGAVDVIWKSASLMDIDIDGIVTSISEKILFWGKRHVETVADDDAPDRDFDTSETGCVLLNLGQGSAADLRVILGTLGDNTPPVILQADVPASCVENFCRFVQRISGRPVRIAENGQQLVDGEIFVLITPSQFTIAREESGTCKFYHVPSTTMPNISASKMHALLRQSGLAPLSIVLSGAVPVASNEVAYYGDKTKEIIVQRPETCAVAGSVKSILGVLGQTTGVYTPAGIGKILGAIK